MDVHCSTCEEPWDTYYLRHEAIYDTSLSEEAAKAWSLLPPEKKLAPDVRKQFAAAGWEFGGSVLNVRHCPCCPKDAEINTGIDQIKTALADLLGDDEDGIAATFEDYGL